MFDRRLAKSFDDCSNIILNRHTQDVPQGLCGLIKHVSSNCKIECSLEPLSIGRSIRPSVSPRTRDVYAVEQNKTKEKVRNLRRSNREWKGSTNLRLTPTWTIFLPRPTLFPLEEMEVRGAS